MSVFREGTNKVWGVVMLVAIFGLLGLDFYWLVTRSGPIGALAELQGGWWGHWYPKITFLLVFLVEIFSVLLVKVGLEVLIGKPLTQPLSGPPEE